MDKRPVPGDMVLVRGTEPKTVWGDMDELATGHRANARIGVVMPGALGFVVGARSCYTYVLWSCPHVAGWISDGCLRKV